MIDARFRPLPVWPYPPTKDRRSSLFKVPWSRTLQDLDRELRLLDAANVIIAAGFREQDLRNDGWPKERAITMLHPGVELSFDSRFGRLVYATDMHEPRWANDPPGWQSNLRAIALGLQALRAVERYGVTRHGEQYAGWKALPGTALGGMDPDAARAILRDLSGLKNEGPLILARYTDLDMYRMAVKKAHPDGGGTTAVFLAVQEAAKVLGVAS